MKTPEWICNDGSAICLSAMSTSHIQAAWAYLRTGPGPYGPMLSWECSGFTNAEGLFLFETELLRRSRRI